jgi:hypothetical protein
MRKIEEQMIQAIVKKKNWKSGNTEVVINSNEIIVNLYGNRIAYAACQPDSQNDWEMAVFDGRHRTVTTKSRVNALLSYFAGPWGIVQQDFEWYVTNTHTSNKTPFCGELSFSTRI